MFLFKKKIQIFGFKYILYDFNPSNNDYSDRFQIFAEY